MKKKNKKTLPKTWEEFANEKLPIRYLDKGCIGFPTDDEDIANFAFRKLCWLSDEYNGCKYEGASDIYHFCISNVNKIYSEQSSHYIHILGFKTSELRDEFQKNFADLIQKAKPLL